MGEVFVVDSQPSVTLVPPKKGIKGLYILYILLGLALLGVVIEGLLIYQLFQRFTAQTTPDISLINKQIGENRTQKEDEISLSQQNLKTKTAAFLHYNHVLKSGESMMQWDNLGFPAFLQSLNYSKGNLIINKDGYYFLFSKVSFKINGSTFSHEVQLNSSRYNNHPVMLMLDKRHSCVDQKKPYEKNQFSSYLGGVFNLVKKDRVFVSVSDYSCLVADRKQNFFGGFMI